MWGNCGSGNLNSHWAAKLMPQALCLLLHVVGGGRGAWSIVGGEQRPHVLKANSLMWWGSFLREVPLFTFRELKGCFFFTVTQAKDCLHNSLDLASCFTSGLAAGLTLHVWGWLLVAVVTQLAKDAAVAAGLWGGRGSKPLLLTSCGHSMFHGVDGGTKQALGCVKHCVDTEIMP